MRLKSISLILVSTAVLIAMCASNRHVSTANAGGQVVVTVDRIDDPNACGGAKIRTKPLIPRLTGSSNVLVWQSMDGPMTITFDDPAIKVPCTKSADPRGRYSCTSAGLENPTGSDLDEAYGIVLTTSKGEVREDPVIIVRPGP